MAAIEAESGMLVVAQDAHFAWLLGDARPPSPELSLPPGGVDAMETLQLLRAMSQRLHEAGSRGSWLIVVEREVVGLCGYKRPADAAGTVEIGYGIAECRRNSGHATRAVRAMLAYASGDPAVTAVIAATSVSNIASQTVLERNGLRRTGTTHDPDDGELIWWRKELR
jgi:RimJ/RimL family protein N-acetyltransferase